jgi:alkyl hydroperoxide reductase subunit AhpC
MATAGRKLEEMAKLAMKMEEEGASAEHMKQMVFVSFPYEYLFICSKCFHPFSGRDNLIS